MNSNVCDRALLLDCIAELLVMKKDYKNALKKHPGRLIDHQKSILMFFQLNDISGRVPFIQKIFPNGSSRLRGRDKIRYATFYFHCFIFHIQLLINC